MAEQKKIALYLLTGFLGAGKTTLLKELLNMLSDKKAGLVINEFGKVGVDGKVIQRDGIELVEINNGSIFCTCLEGSFIEKVTAFSKLPIEYLFVESSGLSDPSNMESILHHVQRMTDNAFEFKGSLCVVDSKNFSKLFHSLHTFQRQINYSNLIILNKTDLVDRHTVETITEKIKEVNPMAGIVKTTYCKLDKKILEKDFSDFRFPEAKASNNCPNNRPEIFVLKTNEKVTQKQILVFVLSIATDTFRVKGFVHLEDGLYHLDCVGDDVAVKPSNLSRDVSEIVVISKDGADLGPVIRKQWDALIGTEMTIE